MTDDSKPTPPSEVPDASSSIVEAVEPADPALADDGGGGGTQQPDGAGNRSRSLYVVLGIGVVSLLVLLGIIYFSATKRENPEQPICTAVSTDAAEQAILAGQVQRIVVNYDDQVEDTSDARWGPVLARVDYADGSCGNLPQGIVARDEMTRILGVAYFYNQLTTEKQVEISLRGTDTLNPALLTVPTATPTQTPELTPTPATPVIVVVTATPEPTSTSTEIPTETPSPAPTDSASPIAAGTAKPSVSLSATEASGGRRTPEPTETARP